MTTTQFTDLWPLILQAQDSIFQAIAASTQAKLGEWIRLIQVPKPKYVFHFIYIVENFNPYHLSVSDYQRRDPFDNPQLVADNFAQFAALGFVQPINTEVYQITEKGYDIRQQRWQILNEILAEVNLLATADLQHLLALLQQVVEATAVVPEPPPKWAMTIRQEHGLKLIENSHPLFRFINYRMDLGAYRDDAHLATWRNAFTISPSAWEAFSHIWSGQANTLDLLLQQLSRRGYPQSTYTTALQDLQQRDWVIKDGNSYRLTEAGQNIRQTAEQQTNDSFYKPWSILNHDEIEKLYTLLKQLTQDPDFSLNFI